MPAMISYEFGPLPGVPSHGIGLTPRRVGTGDLGVYQSRAVVEEEYNKYPTQPCPACGSGWGHEWSPSWGVEWRRVPVPGPLPFSPLDADRSE